MKNDRILSDLVNFLVPLIFLCGMFILAGFFQHGFAAVIYAAVFFVSAVMIFLVRFNSARIAALINWEYLHFFLLLLLISYLVGVLVIITSFFSL